MGKVDVLAFDACLMQMAEVAYEVKDLADYVVGSEETEPGPGYPYDPFLAGLLGHASLKTTEIYIHVSTEQILRTRSPFDLLGTAEARVLG